MGIPPIKNGVVPDKQARSEDVSTDYPRTNYFYSPSVNKEALGVERTELTIPVQSEYLDENKGAAVASEVGKIQVQETPGGIKIVLDDTPSNKRIVIKHPTGGGIEFKPDGSVLVSAIKGKVDVTGADTTVIVGGDATLEYQGNLNMKVTGEFNIDCLDFNVTTRGNKTETIAGTESKTIGRGSTSEIVGQKVTYVTESVVDTFLNGYEHNVKGDMNTNVQGDIGIFSSGDADITSETDVNIASPNTTLSGDKLSVMGGSGSIGGTAVNFTGNGGVFTKGVTATVFTGDLNGKANDAAQADYATTAGAAPTGSAGTAGSTVTTDTPSFPQINATKVTAYNGSEFGIKEVTIDDTNDIKNFIDQSTNYQGVHYSKPTTAMARSAMRDPANRNNSQLTTRYVRDGVIDESFSTPTPPAIGRVITEESTPIISTQSIDLYRNNMYATYVPKAKFANITPEEKYNPLLIDE